MAFNARGIVQNEIYQKLMFDKLEIMRTYVNTFSNVTTKVLTYSHLQSLTQGFGLGPINPEIDDFKLYALNEY